MSDQALSSFGIKVQIGDGGDPESFTDIAELFDVDGPTLGSEQEDVTTHNSIEAWVDKLMTVKDGGQISFDIAYIPTEGTHDASTGLLADYNNRVLRNFKVVFPNASSTTWTVSAYVIQFQPSAPVKGVLTSSITLEISGKPTLN